jgi:hypothetical protein
MAADQYAREMTKIRAVPGEFEFCSTETMFSAPSRIESRLNLQARNDLYQLVAPQPIIKNQKSLSAALLLNFCANFDGTIFPRRASKIIAVNSDARPAMMNLYRLYEDGARRRLAWD